MYEGLKVDQFCQDPIIWIQIEVGRLKLWWNQKEVLLESLLQVYDLDLPLLERRFEKPVQLKEKFELSTYNCHPFVFYNEETKTCNGVEYQMVNEILKGHYVVCNFLDLNEIHDEHPAKYAIDRVISNESDLAACGFWQVALMTLQNTSITNAVGQLCIGVLVPKPKLLPEFSYVFQPMQLNIWLTIIIFILLGSKLMQLVSKLNFRGLTEGRIVYDEFLESLLQTIQLFTFGSVIRQPSLKQLALCWILCSFSVSFSLLSTAYAVGSNSIFTYPRFTKPILTIGDLVESDYKVVSQDSRVYKDMLSLSVDPQIRKLARKVVDSSNGLVEYARLVIITDGNNIQETENFTDYEKTHLRVLKGCVFKTNTALVLPLNSPLVDYFNRRIMEINENGLDKHWYRMATIKTVRYMDNFYTSYVSRDFEPTPLNWRKVQAAFYVLIFGFICASVAFVFELYCRKLCENISL